MKSLFDYYDDSPTKAKTRGRIVSAAIKLFSADGMEIVSLVDIAKAIEMAPRNLYRYYASKEYLVVDAAYQVFYEYNQDEFTNIQGTGYEKLKKRLWDIYAKDLSEQHGLNLMKFVMYFDLYILKMDTDHEAYQKYTTVYRSNFNEPGYADLKDILQEGIKDQTLSLREDEIDFYIDFIVQTMMSIIMRTIVKEAENPRINGLIVEKHIEVILNDLRS